MDVGPPGCGTLPEASLSQCAVPGSHATCPVEGVPTAELHSWRSCAVRSWEHL